MTILLLTPWVRSIPRFWRHIFLGGMFFNAPHSLRSYVAQLSTNQYLDLLVNTGTVVTLSTIQ